MYDPGILVPIISVVMVFAIPIVAIVGGLVYANRRARLQQELLMKLAESGQPLPPEILNSALFQGAHRSARRPLRGPLVVMAAGLGTGLYGWLLHNESLAGAGLIPLLIGIAMLIPALIEMRRGRHATTQPEPDRPQS